MRIEFGRIFQIFRLSTTFHWLYVMHVFHASKSKYIIAMKSISDLLKCLAIYFLISFSSLNFPPGKSSIYRKLLLKCIASWLDLEETKAKGWFTRNATIFSFSFTCVKKEMEKCAEALTRMHVITTRDILYQPNMVTIAPCFLFDWMRMIHVDICTCARVHVCVCNGNLINVSHD